MNTPIPELTKSAEPQNPKKQWGTTDLDRFMRYVRVTDTCWLWTGSSYTQFGARTYGQFYLAGRRTSAHRASYILHRGAIPDGLDILHSCDVKACVNPDHLRPGTHQENIREAFDKLPAGHFAGENNGRARLTWDDVHAIRSIGGRTIDLARRYGVLPQQISNIKHGRKWPESSCPVHGAEKAEVAA